MQVYIQALRDFASMLTPEDFSQCSEDGLAPNLGGMKECRDAQEFLNWWAPPTIGCTKDLLRGIDAFKAVARNAADRFEGTDGLNAQKMKEILADEIDGVVAHPNSVPVNTSQLPHPRPLETPPSEPSGEPSGPPNDGNSYMEINGEYVPIQRPAIESIRDWLQDVFE